MYFIAGYSIYNCCKSKNKYQKIDLYDTELPNVTENLDILFRMDSLAKLFHLVLMKCKKYLKI